MGSDIGSLNGPYVDVYSRRPKYPRRSRNILPVVSPHFPPLDGHKISRIKVERLLK
jgi:hypothetical protein